MMSTLTTPAAEAQRVDLSLLAGALECNIFSNDLMYGCLRRLKNPTPEERAVRTHADTELAHIVFEYRECVASVRQFPQSENQYHHQEQQLAKSAMLLDRIVAEGLRMGIHLPIAILTRWEAERSVGEQEKDLNSKKGGSLRRRFRNLFVARTTKRIERVLENV
ncbi:hypothetical protein Hypma_012309 [Hypsizygus marmoreus]|uniref:Uncharacterized protein n=1 Tax=Hypsizygus marmoreus TaxID=39966 RepID=A0A369JH30_HYPMA|nr:hypothetical protein Hypma_012309 [Hypsizygus marmoreus]